MDLPTTIELCHELLLKQGGIIEEMLSRIAELEARLSQNSSNSSRPPSSDGLSKQPAFPRSLRGKRGGQPGHRGNTLKMVEMADQRVVHSVGNVCECGSSLSDVVGQVGSKRQVFDLPPQRLIVTEHQCQKKTCPSCGKLHQSDFPAGVNAPVQYGGRVKALVSLLSVGHNMPVGGHRGAASRVYLLTYLVILSTKPRFREPTPGTMKS